MMGRTMDYEAPPVVKGEVVVRATATALGQDPRFDPAVLEALPYQSFTLYRPLRLFELALVWRPAAAELHARVTFDATTTAADAAVGGAVDGGAVGAACDEVLGSAVFCAHCFGPTLRLAVSYLAPVPVATPLGLVAQVLPHPEGDAPPTRTRLRGTLRADTGTVLATVESVFFNPQHRRLVLPAASTWTLPPPVPVEPAFVRMITAPAATTFTAVPAWVDALAADADVVPDPPTSTGFLDGRVTWQRLTRRSDPDASLVVVRMSDTVQGPPGCVNGGCLYALLHRAAEAALGHVATLDVQYHRFARIVDRWYLVTCQRTSSRSSSDSSHGGGGVGSATLAVRNPASDTVHCSARAHARTPAAARL
jgi:acyl-coenzyme A thioesterase PaaI-like protein